MNRTELKEHLAELRTQVAALEDTDEQTRKAFANLIESVERQIEEPEDRAHHPSLLELLRNIIKEFEVEHPRLTDTLNRILVGMGG